MAEAMNRQEEELSSQPVGRTIQHYGIPCMLSMLTTTIYNIVDQVFIGQGVGYLGNSATNVIFPLTTIGLAFGLLVGTGCAARFSLMLGSGRKRRAAKCAGNAIVLMFIMGILFAVITRALLSHIVVWFGATDLVYDYAMDYGSIICYGFSIYLISIGLGHILRADGRPSIGTYATLAGCISNVILDAIFIFVFGWGVKGAAWATNIGIAISLVIELVAIFHLKTTPFEKSDFRLEPQLCLKMMMGGLVDFALNLSVTIIFVVNNNLLTTWGAYSVYGSEIPLANYGIMQKIVHIITSIATGMAQGAQPVIGYSFGKGDIARVKKAVSFTLKQGLVIGIVLEILALVFARPILLLFGSESELYMEFGVKCIRIYMSLSFLFALQTTVSNIFTALGYSFRGAVLAFTRNALVPVIAGVILCRFVGVMGVLYEGPIAGFVGGVLSVILIAGAWKELGERERETEAAA